MSAATIWNLSSGVGLPARIERLNDFEFVTVAPQCHASRDWTPHVFNLPALVDETVVRYRIDPDRIYLTGLNMGARGSWRVVHAAPDRFAALSGRSELDDGQLAALHHLPVWLFHGGLDSVVTPDASRHIEAIMREAGGDVRRVCPKFLARPWHWSRGCAKPNCV